VIVTAEEGRIVEIFLGRDLSLTVARMFDIDCKNLFEFMKAVGGFSCLVI
jgi:hypothetical protein